MSAPRPTPAPPVIPGFTPVRVLGSGGFADVFLYEQDMPARRVAVKVMYAAPGGGSALAGRFDLEANLMARLSTHPSIATIYQTGFTADGRPFLVMEYCPNGSLDTRYRRDRMSVAEVLRIGVQVASAVETAHRAGIVHRDIKPANILLTEYGRAALTDFGISVGDAEPEDEAEGLSVPWSAPEVLAGAPGVDGRLADVYSLAATVYTLLAGRWPFEVPGGSNDVASLTRRIATGALPSTGRPDVPPDLERTLAVGMARDPAQRFPTALEFARALQVVQVRLGEPVTPVDVADDLGFGDVDDAEDSLTTIRPAGSPAGGVGWPPFAPGEVAGSSPGAPVLPPTPAPGPQRPAGSLGKAPGSGADAPAEPPFDTVLRPTPAPRPTTAQPGGSPPAVSKRRGAVLAVAGAVVVLLAAVTGAFLLLQDRAAGSVVAGSAEQPRAARVTPAPPAAIPVRTPEPVPTVTVTVAPPAVTQPPAISSAPRGAGDLGLTAPIANIGCTGEYVLLVASTADPGLYRDMVTTHLANQAEARYLRTDASCGSFNQSLDGNPIYAVYLGPYGTRAAACTALAASSAPVDAAVRALVADRTGRREYCTCQHAPESLPQLSVETAADPPLALGRTVAEVQSMLYFTGFSPSYALDGRFGEKTEEWVKAYQEARGLPVVGEVGPMTWSALHAELCP